MYRLNKSDCQSDVRAAAAMFRHIPRYTSTAFRPATSAREAFQNDALGVSDGRGGDGDEVHATAVAMTVHALVAIRAHTAMRADLNIESRDVTACPPLCGDFGDCAMADPWRNGLGGAVATAQIPLCVSKRSAWISESYRSGFG